MQATDTAVVDEQLEPRGQGKHAVIPVCGAYVPAGHATAANCGIGHM